MHELTRKGQNARRAAFALANLPDAQKSACLLEMAKLLKEQQADIFAANEQDLIFAREKGIRETMQDRLKLNEARIEGMCASLREIAAMQDPIGEVTGMVKCQNGLLVGKMRVPLGVIGIIYESRPNVTIDAAALCLKAGNAVILRGGSEAIRSNLAILKVMKQALLSFGIDEGAVDVIEDTSRETATAFMKLGEYLDLLIPRGGASLIQTVVENATVPVIETGTGNCHIYVDEYADLKMALSILVNAKVSRPSVCNAAESLVVHKKIRDAFLKEAVPALQEKGVELRAEADVAASYPDVKLATEDDFYTEYNDYILSIKTVGSIEEAIAHINEHSTKHSEAIVTKDYRNAQKFLQEIDSAAVYVNASTRFTDGGEFGLGAEIGISTQKVHARGPMGIDALTSIKYIIYGDGQIRE